jgi:hypothetical protein
MTSSLKQLGKPKLKLVIVGLVSSCATADQTERWKNGQHEKLCQSSDQSIIKQIFCPWFRLPRNIYKLHQSAMLKLANTSLALSVPWATYVNRVKVF